MKKEKVEVLERESFVQLCNDFQGFIDLMLPCFNDSDDAEVNKANLFFRTGLTDLKDFLRNLAIVPPKSK